MSDLTMEPQVFIVQSFYERQQSFAAAIRAYTKYSKHTNGSSSTLRRLRGASPVNGVFRSLISSVD